MTGRDDELLPEGVPAFDDPTYDGLRAELADLGDVGPMPADVAARLDDVLAGLSAGDRPAAVLPDEARTDAPVAPLRRRSRTGSRLLIAAAAVVAVGGGGIGLANVVGDGLGGSDGDAGSVMAEDDPASAPEAAAGGGDTGSGLQDSTTDLPGAGAGYAATVPRLSTDRFADQAGSMIRDDLVLRTALLQAARFQAGTKTPQPTAGNLFDNGGTPTARGPLSGGGEALDLDPLGRNGDEQAGGATLDELTGAKKALQSCALNRVLGGVARPVLLDGDPAILVVYPLVGGSRLVQARSCDANTVLISATVPAS